MPLLFDYFAAGFAAAHNRAARALAPADFDALLAHAWPGNVRELRNLAERFILGGGHSNLAHLLARRPATGIAPRQPLSEQVDAFEKRLIEQALERCKGDIKAVMGLLDIPRRTLNEKMARHGIDRERYLER